MKKRLLFLIVLLVGLLVSAQAMGAGSCSGVMDVTMAGKVTITVSCTADAADASVPDYAFTADMNSTLQGRGGWSLVNVVTTPDDTTAPTDATDLQLQDADGRDVLGGAGTDMVDATSTLDFYPENTQGDYRYYPVVSDLTQVVSNNAVNSAEFTVQYIFQ